MRMKLIRNVCALMSFAGFIMPLPGCSLKPHDAGTVVLSAEKGTCRLRMDGSCTMGAIIQRVYQGTIPDGTACTLSVYGYEHSGDAIFSISVLNDSLALYAGQGIAYTLRGEGDATVWECRTCGGETFYFFVEGNGERLYWAQDDMVCDKSHVMQLVVKETGKTASCRPMRND